MEKIDHKNKWIQPIIFILLFLIIFISLNRPLWKATDSRWYAFKQLPENSLDILFIGNSRLFCSINPKIIDNVLGTKSFNIGVSAETIAVSYFELIEALKTQSPSIVVLETFTLDLYPERNQRYFREFLWNSQIGFSTSNFITTIIKDPEEYYQAFPLTDQHSLLWKAPSDYPNEKLLKTNSEENLYLNSNGFLPREQIINQTDFENSNINQQSPSPPHPENQRYLEKIIKLCKKHNIELILIEMPGLRPPDKDINTYGPFNKQEIAKKYNLQLISFDPNSFYSLINYSDPEHLSVRGAYDFTLRIADQISQSHDLKTQKNKVKYFQSFLIEDLTLIHENNQTTASFTQPKTNENLFYYWKLNSTQITANKDKSDETFFTFEQSPENQNIILRIINERTKKTLRLVIPLQ